MKKSSRKSSTRKSGAKSSQLEFEGLSPGNITLKGKEVETREGFVLVSDLKFYPENPRLYTLVSADSGEADQDEILKKLKDMDHVKKLMQSIRANGGLTDPVIVRDGDLVVLEGNSRLAAYKLLAKSEPTKFSKIKCKILPAGLNDKEIFSLLSDYHIVGRKDWAPYEQAGFFYRQNKKHNVSVEEISKEIGISLNDVKRQIEVYEFMQQNNPNPEKWSHYFEYLKNKKIQAEREKNKDLDKHFVSQVKANKIQKAQDVRDKLPKVVQAGGTVLANFLSKKKNLEESFEVAKEKNVAKADLAKLTKFKEWIGDPDNQNQLDEASAAIKKEMILALKKIAYFAERVEKKLSNKE